MMMQARDLAQTCSIMLFFQNCPGHAKKKMAALFPDGQQLSYKMYAFSGIILISSILVGIYDTPIGKAQNVSPKIELTAILSEMKVIFRYEL